MHNVGDGDEHRIEPFSSVERRRLTCSVDRFARRAYIARHTNGAILFDFTVKAVKRNIISSIIFRYLHLNEKKNHEI